MTPKAAVSALRGLPLFDRMSLRLLHDLVEYASLEAWWEDPGRPRPDEAPPGSTGILPSTLPGGTLAERRFRKEWLAEALEGSFSLARAVRGRHEELASTLLPPGHTLDFAEKKNANFEEEELDRVHWLLLVKDELFADPQRPGSDIDLGVAAALLARALARVGADLDEAVLVATFDDTGIGLQRWNADGPGTKLFVSKDPTPTGPYIAEDKDQRSFPAMLVLRNAGQLGGTPDTAWHVLCVAPPAHRPLPTWWSERFEKRAFHRLVYFVRPGRPLQPPTPLLNFLRRGAWNPRWRDGPYFSSVIPTVVLDQAAPPRPWPTWESCLRDLPTLEVTPWENGDADVGGEMRPIGTRLRRDLCRIRVRLDGLGNCDADPSIAASLDRWARAVTNRQVGIALSGGGATSAALMPFLEDLQRYGVPFDVIGGFSGGAILGLYVATSRMTSYYDLFHRLEFNWLFPVSMWWSKAMEHALNCEFHGARLEDLDMRFVPMTVELRTDGSPRACAVVGGTVGEGVRVSGIGLGLIGPAERRGTRYVDGGVAMGVPAKVLPDFGADMVIACNSIVPPNGTDLNAILPIDIGRCLRWTPFLNAVIDRWDDVYVGSLTMLRDSARAGKDDADVYYEVSPDVTPFLQGFFWSKLDRIRAKAAETPGWEEELDQSLERWRRLRGEIA